MPFYVLPRVHKGPQSFMIQYFLPNVTFVPWKLKVSQGHWERPSKWFPIWKRPCGSYDIMMKSHTSTTLCTLFVFELYHHCSLSSEGHPGWLSTWKEAKGHRDPLRKMSCFYQHVQFVYSKLAHRTRLYMVGCTRLNGANMARIVSIKEWCCCCHWWWWWCCCWCNW